MISRHRATIALLSLVLLLGIAILSASQDKKRDAQLRTVHGSVIDASQNPVPTSVVYLKNIRTQAIKTHITDDSGNYRFSGLDPNVDYEIHAEHDPFVSSNHTVSSYDSRRDIEVTLKLDKKAQK
ncbi:MAG: carboxypeptidase-like regulatory domain-containing protein [Candidatus Acidiferrales bacterium]